MINTKLKEGRKIPHHLENPIDNLVIGLAKPIQPILYQMRVTPNMITTIGVILRVLAIYHLFQGNNKFFLITALGSYFMDCLDGDYARRYDMCTRFGDYYDHCSDLIFHIIILYYLFIHTSMSDSKHKYNWIMILILLMYLMCWQLGCQEDYYDNQKSGIIKLKSETLNIFRAISCGRREMICFTRYFGCGTFVLIVYLLIYFYN